MERRRKLMSYSAFKNTVIGRIPCDWAIKKLGEVGRVKMCKRIFKHETSAEGDIPFFKIGTFGQIADAFISREKFESFKSLYPYPRKDTPLISAAGTIGRIVLHDGQDAYYQDSNIVWLEHDEREVLNSYLSYYYSVIKWVTETGSAITRLYNNQLLSALIAVPCIKEQHAIATVLSDMDALLEAKTALLEKKRAIKQGAMQELLTGRRRLPGFPVTPMKKTDIGEIPEDWKLVSFESDASFKARIGWQGLTTSEYLKYGYAYLITGTDFDKGKINWQDCHYVTRERYQQDSNIQVEKNDILITKDGTIGKVAYLPELDTPATLNSGVFVVRPKNNSFQPHFMYHILGSSVFRAFLDKLTAGSTIVHLYQKDLGNFACYIPQLAGEQEAIAGILSNMDDEIAFLEQELKKLQDLKQGMLRDLLTGRIRLVK